MSHDKIIGARLLQENVDLEVCPWMEFALQKFGTQSPRSQDAPSAVWDFFQGVNDRSTGQAVVVWDANPGQGLSAWCSAFVNWCFSQSGIPGPHLADAASWASWGKKCSPPHWGCVAIVKMGENFHVGFFISTVNGRHYILGGNQNVRGFNGVQSVNITSFGPGFEYWFRMPN